MQALLPSELIELVQQDHAGEGLSNCVQRIESLAALMRGAKTPLSEPEVAAQQRFGAACAAAVEQFKLFWSEHSLRRTSGLVTAPRSAGTAELADLKDLHLLVTAGLLAIEQGQRDQASLILGCIRASSESSAFAVIAQAVAHFAAGDVKSSVLVLNRAAARGSFLPAELELMQSFKAYLIASHGGDARPIANRILASSTNTDARRIANMALH